MDSLPLLTLQTLRKILLFLKKFNIYDNLKYLWFLFSIALNKISFFYSVTSIRLYYTQLTWNIKHISETFEIKISLLNSLTNSHHCFEYCPPFMAMRIYSWKNSCNCHIWLLLLSSAELINFFLFFIFCNISHPIRSRHTTTTIMRKRK